MAILLFFFVVIFPNVSFPPGSAKTIEDSTLGILFRCLAYDLYLVFTIVLATWT